MTLASHALRLPAEGYVRLLEEFVRRSNGRAAVAGTALWHSERSHPLFDALPALRGRLPWLPLASLPTPVEEWPSGDDRVRLFVKRDDLTSARYGGNKVRKLEFVLADAALHGARTLVTMGGLGSNQALATALHGAAQGFDVDVALFPQPDTPHARRNLLGGIAAGATLRYGHDGMRGLLAAVHAWRASQRRGARPYLIPFGATTALGTMGYVGAAFELAAQVRAGFLPEPDRIVVAAGTGGTAAGLVAGGRLAGLASRVVAVRVFDAVVANRHVIAAQARAVVRRLRHLDPTLPDVTVDADDLDVDPRWFGGMYGRPTPEAERAVREGAPGLALETTYTGKAFAACLAHCRDAPAGQVVLFWHTHNAVAFPCASSDALPPSLQALLGSSHVQARRSASP